MRRSRNDQTLIVGQVLILQRSENQNYLGQLGAMRITWALSWLIFHSTCGLSEMGKKAYLRRSVQGRRASFFKPWPRAALELWRGSLGFACKAKGSKTAFPTAWRPHSGWNRESPIHGLWKKVCRFCLLGSSAHIVGTLLIGLCGFCYTIFRSWLSLHTGERILFPSFVYIEDIILSNITWICWDWMSGSVVGLVHPSAFWGGREAHYSPTAEFRVASGLGAVCHGHGPCYPGSITYWPESLVWPLLWGHRGLLARVNGAALAIPLWDRWTSMWK